VRRSTRKPSTSKISIFVALSDIHPTAARGFDAGAEAYERGRPGYPDAAIAWLAERLALRRGRTVLDLAAGTGKLTRQLVPTGSRVIAVEPTEGMRRQLERVLPGIEALPGTAEEIPLPDGSVDAVTVAQAFHWFRVEEALPEIHRVLRPSGGLALIWNSRDLDDPLQAELERILTSYRERLGDFPDWRPPLEASGLFGPVEETTFRFEQRLDADTLVERVHSISVIAALPDHERRTVLERVRAAASGLEEPFAFPYVTEVFMCFRQTEPA
jgi:SAM-dependent methyltransferase